MMVAPFETSWSKATLDNLCRFRAERGGARRVKPLHPSSFFLTEEKSRMCYELESPTFVAVLQPATVQ